MQGTNKARRTITHLITEDAVGGRDAPVFGSGRYLVKEDARDHRRRTNPAQTRMLAGSRLSLLGNQPLGQWNMMVLMLTIMLVNCWKNRYKNITPLVYYYLS